MKQGEEEIQKQLERHALELQNAKLQAFVALFCLPHHFITLHIAVDNRLSLFEASARRWRRWHRACPMCPSLLSSVNQ